MNLNKSTFFISYVALVSSAAFVSRLVFQSIPNMQPLTDIIIMSSLFISSYFGSLIAILSMFISNIYLGMGPWTIAQIIAYLIICLTIKLAKRFLIKSSIIVRALFSGFLGYLYGFIISLIQAPFIGIDIFWVYYLQGITFDSLHAVGNILFYFILEPVIKPIFLKMKNRISS
ncbi:ECF transporter S component [Vagococcus vulneris]|uniref:ECF transporter S component n=1 Tax=Vagococcus vulneris TaxID=1977869 RepID=A0A429ZXJ5_9ENTE|nr:ECF transporter S component [Vagococcus vulneris]RST98441.1 hypothetical protein CBF37_07970 [Vagococcus vulneris]